MMGLKPVGERFNEPVQVLGGPRLRARIQRVSDNDQPGAEFALPKTSLRVLPHSLMKSGLVVRLPGGELGLTADHSRTPDYRTHHVFPVDRKVQWTRPTSDINPVSKQKTSTGSADMGTIWVMWERTRREFMDLSIRVAQENYLVATGAPVEIDDFIDGKVVRRVSKALGIRVLELQG